MSAERDQLICNARECFKKIEDTAWITCCSHIFCAQHGKEIKLRQATSPGCPACGSRFRNESDLVERKLNHSLQFRALLLCGYSPELVMEIANNAITFWNFQKHQVCSNLERKVEYYRETIATLKRKLTQEKGEAEGKILRLEQQLEQTKSRMAELNEAAASLTRDRRGELSRKDRCEKKHRTDDFLF
ncbi:E3 ubiquitin-protein ligase CCNB1IP1-like [Toxorhynchites rutilus septentrionalis]|uniref:E3 ubiquitin-protein ligase CCNB1IP1-like n=1 Tax=Toxorhynchites rutilus septentrionalis TaxID=329112 RepID=UPI00247A2584|nr:E3 ubiquitin-protein ligase CCNB1IP1-like [Toxorhynchites rutilus septentrionalis]